MMQCPDMWAECEWNKTAYWHELDPYWQHRAAEDEKMLVPDNEGMDMSMVNDHIPNGSLLSNYQCAPDYDTSILPGSYHFIDPLFGFKPQITAVGRNSFIWTSDEDAVIMSQLTGAEENGFEVDYNAAFTVFEEGSSV